MRVDELAPGLWRWTGLHPDWKPTDGGPNGWEQEVGCVYYEAPDAICLVDPLVPPEDSDGFWTALDRDVERAKRPVAALLTVPWHGRSAPELVGRYGAELWASAAALGADGPAVTHPYQVGDPLPGGLVAFEAAAEIVYWIPEHRAAIPGDILLGDGAGGVRICPPSWLPKGTTLENLRDSLRPLLDLHVERILVSHGEPVLAGGRAALARALEA